MAKRVAFPKLSVSSVPEEISADMRLAAAIAELKERHKEAKAELRRRHSQERAEEEAEARRKEDRRVYLLGQALRRDSSETAVSLASSYAERLTHTADRKLFGLPPLPETGDKSARAAESAVENFGKETEDEDDKHFADAPSNAATGNFPAPSDMEEGEGSQENALLDTMVVSSENHPDRHGSVVENAAADGPGDASRPVGDDRSAPLTIGPEERDTVASANLRAEDRQTDPDANAGVDPASPSTEIKGHSDRHRRGVEDADADGLGNESCPVGDDCFDPLTTRSEERNAVASADPDSEDRQADPDKSAGVNPASSSTAMAENTGREDGGTLVQVMDDTAVEQAPVVEQAALPSFEPRVFASQASLKAEIDRTGAKRTKTAGGRWIATASTPEQAVALAALKLQPCEPE